MIEGEDLQLDLSQFNGTETEFREWTGSEKVADPISLRIERLEQAITRLYAIIGVNLDEVMPG